MLAERAGRPDLAAGLWGSVADRVSSAGQRRQAYLRQVQLLEESEQDKSALELLRSERVRALLGQQSGAPDAERLRYSRLSR